MWSWLLGDRWGCCLCVSRGIDPTGRWTVLFWWGILLYVLAQTEDFYIVCGWIYLETCRNAWFWVFFFVPLQVARQQTEGAAAKSVRLSRLVGGSVLVCMATSSTKTANAALLWVSHINARQTAEPHAPTVKCPTGSLASTSTVNNEWMNKSQLNTHIKRHVHCSILAHETVWCYSPGPTPYLLVANLVAVRRINPDGTGDQTLVEDPRGTIIALDYDPVKDKVR